MPGPKLIQGDALSRRPDHVDTDEDNDKEFYILIPPECIISTLQREYDERIMEAQLRATMTTLADEIKHLTEKDRFASLIKSNLAAGKTPIKSDSLIGPKQKEFIDIRTRYMFQKITISEDR